MKWFLIVLLVDMSNAVQVTISALPLEWISVELATPYATEVECKDAGAKRLAALIAPAGKKWAAACVGL